MDKKIMQVGLWSLFSIYSFFLFGNLLFFRIVDLFMKGFNSYYYSDDGFKEGWINLDSLLQNANFIPFRTIWLFVYHYNSDYFQFSVIFYNLFLNIMAFMPLGMFIPLIFRKMKKMSHFLIWICTLLLSIEILQLLLHIGQFDIDDVILNAIGSLIGFASVTFMTKWKDRVVWWNM